MALPRGILSALSLAALLTGASEAFASTYIYVNDGSTGDIWEYDSSDALYERLAGNLSAPYPGFPGFNLAAFSISSGPAANSLYITMSDPQTFASVLHRMDLTTGATTAIGGNVTGNALGEGRDGWLYAGSGSSLIRVDPATGATVLVGNGAFGYAGDLAVDPTDIASMYGAVGISNEDFTEYHVSLVRVDRNTGAQTVIGSFGLPNQSSIYGLGFGLDGTLFATGPTGYTTTTDPVTGFPTTAYTSAIYTINKSTGAATFFRSMNYSAYDMATQPFTTQEPVIPNPPAFQPPTTGAVPEPMTLGLAGLGAAAAAVRARRA